MDGDKPGPACNGRGRHRRGDETRRPPWKALPHFWFVPPLLEDRGGQTPEEFR